MKSHTVPKRLLRQFSYQDDSTRSLRLWRYEKGRAPYPLASPTTATRIDGYFADPNDAPLEDTIERRLAEEIENPVNQFISDFHDASFVMTDTQRSQMTRYICLLYHRSMARRAATRQVLGVRSYALSRFLENDVQLATVALYWNLDAYFRRIRLSRLVTIEDVARGARSISYPSAADEQTSYAQTMVQFIVSFDELMYRGEWKLVGTTPVAPFILSDTPVVTWERLATGAFGYGLGFHRSNVEVLLPVSPVTCLHILPHVKRTRPTITPSVSEINNAQVVFAHRACFSNRGSSEIDCLVQQYISTVKLGQNFFTAWHRNYDTFVYDILMRPDHNLFFPSIPTPRKPAYPLRRGPIQSGDSTR